MSLRVGDDDESALFFKRKDQDYESNNEPPNKVKLENHTEGASELVPGSIGDKAWKILAAKIRHHKFFGKKFITTKILFVINETFSTKTSSSTTHITKSTYLRLWISNYCKAVRIHPICVKPYPTHTHNQHHHHNHHHHHHHHHSSSSASVSISFNYSLYIKLFHYMDLTEHPEIIIEEKKIQEIIVKYIKEKRIGEIYEGEEELIVEKKNEKSNSTTTIHNVRKEIDMKLEQVTPPVDEPATHLPLSYLNTYHAPVHHLSLGPDEKPDEITSFYPHSHIDGLSNPRTTTDEYLYSNSSQKLNNKLLTTDSLGNFFMNFDWPKNGRIPLLKILSNTLKKRNFYVNALLILIADYAASLPTQKQMSEIRIAKWRETLLVSR